jgi:hypothetical protein
MTMSIATRTPADGSLVIPGLTAAMVAAMLNVAIFAVAVAAGVFPTLRLDTAAELQMGIELVVLSTVVGALAGMGAFALVRRLSSDPLRTFYVIAVAVLLISFVAPFTLPVTLAQGMVMNVMHVVVAVLVVQAVRRAGAT